MVNLSKIFARPIQRQSDEDHQAWLHFNNPFMTLAHILGVKKRHVTLSQETGERQFAFERNFKLIRRLAAQCYLQHRTFYSHLYSVDNYDIVTSCGPNQQFDNVLQRSLLCNGNEDHRLQKEYGNKFHHANSNDPVRFEFCILKKKKLKKIRNSTEKMKKKKNRS